MNLKSLFFSFIAMLLVNAASAQCAANFTTSQQPNGTVIFNATGGSMFTSYYWNFGNGTSGTGNPATAYYNAPGTYVACLYIVDSVSNCSDSSCVSITITSGSLPCSAAYSYGIQNNTLYLYPTGASASTATYSWFVNNTLVSSTASCTYPFTTGTYNVCLVVNDAANNCTDTVCQTLNLTATTTNCSAQYTYNVGAAGYTTFTANTSANSSSSMYVWSVGSATLYGANASYTFPQNGIYNVCLTVYDSINNCTDSTCGVVNVTTASSNCNSVFSYICYPTSASLTATGSYPASTTFTWTSNGNVVGTGANFLYSPGAGTYTICLIINDTLNNCADTSCQNVVIGSALNCQADFYVYPDSLGAPHTYIGVNTSVGSNLSYTWSWGDGSSATGPYPSHTYASAGNYVICLYIASNSTNCVDTFCLNQAVLKGTSMYTINFQAPASTTQVSTSELNIYPNPVHDAFTIKGIEGTSLDVQILNLHGGVVKAFKAQANRAVDVSSLSNGTYLVKAVDPQGKTGLSKLIKN